MGTCWLLSADWAVLPQLSMSVCVDQWINIALGVDKCGRECGL